MEIENQTFAQLPQHEKLLDILISAWKYFHKFFLYSYTFLLLNVQKAQPQFNKIIDYAMDTHNNKQNGYSVEA